MILSDRTIREEIAAGRILIDPLDESAIQPSSIDIHLDHSFRVFLNHTRTVIDVKEDLRDLTQLVEIDDDGAFILHPGEFVLGSTLERIAVPDDLVSRIEGKSSLARLGLLIHSSLPGSEPVMVLEDGRLTPHPIEDVVRKQLRGMVVAFDPDTFEVGYHPITGWYEGPPDRIFEVTLASGRSVRVTAGHNLFTLDREGALVKVRTGELRPGTRVAVPVRVPDPASARPTLRLAEHVPEVVPSELTIGGPSVARAFKFMLTRSMHCCGLKGSTRLATTASGNDSPIAWPASSLVSWRRSTRVTTSGGAVDEMWSLPASRSTESLRGYSACTSPRATAGRSTWSCRTPIRRCSIDAHQCSTDSA